MVNGCRSSQAAEAIKDSLLFDNEHATDNSFNRSGISPNVIRKD